VGSAQRIRTPSFYAEHYLQLPHALVKTLEGQQTPVDRTLAQLGTKRHVALSLPFFVPAISPSRKPIWSSPCLVDWQK